MIDPRFPDMPADWPWREHSAMVQVDTLQWHVQRAGQGPVLLLVHGTGGSTHSWHAVLDVLAAHWTVVAVDLPGHGFTTGTIATNDRGDRYTLPAMAGALGDLLDVMNISPARVAGHSAGVPILLQLALDGRITPDRIVGFNAALVPPPQFYLTMIAPILGLVVERDLVAQGGAWLARATDIVTWMLSSSGTRLDPIQLERYRWLCTKPDHVHAALTMMSRWELPALLRDALSLRTPVRIVAGARDRWVPPHSLARVIERLPCATMMTEPAGHLLPEERPDIVLRELALDAR